MNYHEHMVLSVKDSIDLSEKKDQNTILLCTSQCDVKVMMWSVLSLLLKAKDSFDSFEICINGCSSKSKRKLQDVKQKFFESLLYDCGVSLNIHRSIGRQGHSNGIDSCIPWIDTEYYTLVHDDVIFKDSWKEELDYSGFLNDPKRSLINIGPFFMMKPLAFCNSIYENKPKLGMPHINSSFVIVKKSVVEDLGVKWQGYHNKVDFKLEGEWARKLIDFYEPIASGNIQEGNEYNYHNTDIGSWVCYKLLTSDYNLKSMKGDFCFHLTEGSWSSDIALAVRINKHYEEIESLEKEILNSKYADLYNEYCKYSNIVL